MPVARCCTEQELSGEHLEPALLLHPCLALLLFPLPGSCSPKDAPNRYLLSLASVSLSLLNSPSMASQALCICLGLPTTHVQSLGWEMQGPCAALTPV